jgi:adenylyltransferase/sulfurtransferase
VGRLLVVDALGMRTREMRFTRDRTCAWCATRTARELLNDYAAFCGETPEPVVTSGSTNPAEATPRTVTPADLAVRLARADGVVLVDVREQWEVDAAPIPGAQHMPMGQVPTAHATLPRDRDIAVICHHGQRSSMVAEYLRTLGFTRVMNVLGGSDRWSVEADPSVPRY